MQQEKIKHIYKNKLLSKKPVLNNYDSQFYYLLKYLSQDKKISILDAGCGNGNYAYKLYQKGYKNIYAVDLFEDIANTQINYNQASIDTLPHTDNMFDLVYSNSVIFYLENPEDGIKEFKRVLKNDATLMFTAHTKYSLFTLWRVFKRDILKLKSMDHLEGVKFYSAKHYRQLLEQNGFEVVLQDGYMVSFFFYPAYQKIVKALKRLVNVNLPTVKPYVNKGISGAIKSEIAYHSVFVAIKKNDKN
jgi:ubiquinone/menaquinone biosynthesis C-methylase UbiE